METLEKTRKNVRDAVVLFEHKEGSKLVDIKDVGALVRSLGVNPSGVQVNIIHDQLAALNAENQASSLLSMEHIEIVVANFLVQQKKALFRDDYHTLMRAFRAFDTEGKGYVDADHMRALLTTRGESMTEEEANKMVAAAVGHNTDNRIYYVGGGGRGGACKRCMPGLRARAMSRAHWQSCSLAACVPGRLAGGLRAAVMHRRPGAVTGERTRTPPPRRRHLPTPPPPSHQPAPPATKLAAAVEPPAAAEPL